MGQKLMLARTYNSLDAPWGKVSQRWWQQYERYLSLSSSTEAVFYDASGATLRFAKNTDGTFATPQGYSQELKKNSDGTYTLSKTRSARTRTPCRPRSTNTRPAARLILK